MIVTSHSSINAQRSTGVWFDEFAAPYAIFKSQGYDVTVASPKGGQTPIDPGSLPDEGGRLEHAEALRMLETTQAISSIDPNEFDALFLPGGHGTMFDLPSEAVGRVVGMFADEGKVIAAVCHGPAGLVGARRADNTPVVRGQRVTAFTNDEEAAAKLTDAMPFLLQDRLAELGASFVPSPMWSDHIVIDGKLVTGQNPQSAVSTARAVVSLLEGQGEAQVYSA